MFLSYKTFYSNIIINILTYQYIILILFFSINIIINIIYSNIVININIFSYISHDIEDFRSINFLRIVSNFKRWRKRFQEDARFLFLN